MKMTTHPLFEYLRKNMDEIHPAIPYDRNNCYFKKPLEIYKTTSTILTIAGYDTTDINNAINEVQAAVDKLKSVTYSARSEFIQSGIQTTVKLN